MCRQMGQQQMINHNSYFFSPKFVKPDTIQSKRHSSLIWVRHGLTNENTLRRKQRRTPGWCFGFQSRIKYESRVHFNKRIED
jgi:hypothetical protein